MPGLPATRPRDIAYSVEEVRAIDRAAIDGAGIPGYTLMARAAGAALELALAEFPRARRWLFLCGGGNNAGDALVMARLAADRGIRVSVVCLADPDGLGGDARRAWEDFRAAGLAADSWSGGIDADTDLIVDGLLGSGLTREVDGEFRDAVLSANRHPAPVLALDIPTGLNGDSGEVMGAAVLAAATVTFVGLKAGLLLGAGPAHSGRVVLADLAIPDDCRRGLRGVLRSLSGDAVREALPPRSRGAHKGSFGHVLIVGGGPGMPGAVRLGGEAALRAGAGLVSVATHPSHLAQVLSGRPELMVHPVTGAGDLSALLHRATVVAVGPGLGTSAWSSELLDTVLAADLPVVADADALNLLAGRAYRRDDWVLTPHPGEAGRLTASSAADVQLDRLGALERLSADFGATVVLKGAASLVSSVAGLPWVCLDGNPGMASPGMGDVLTGIVAGLRAQGYTAEAAAALGVSLHARAGDAAAAAGERGLLASDLLAEIRALANP